MQIYYLVEDFDFNFISYCSDVTLHVYLSLIFFKFLALSLYSDTTGPTDIDKLLHTYKAIIDKPNKTLPACDVVKAEIPIDACQRQNRQRS